MLIVQYVALAALLCCIALFTKYFAKLIRLGKPKDYSQASGSVSKGVLYANTGAMLPQNKESAYMHLPSYAIGIIFHLGTFLSLLIFVLSFFTFFNDFLTLYPIVSWIATGCLGISAICGISLFIKRIFNSRLRILSNPDDFISNALTTLFHIVTLLYLLFQPQPYILTLYYIEAAILLIYMPLGKLHHVMYYFFARYHLGFFYGRRNVWPPQKAGK